MFAPGARVCESLTFSLAPERVMDSQQLRRHRRARLTQRQRARAHTERRLCAAERRTQKNGVVCARELPCSYAKRRRHSGEQWIVNAERTIHSRSSSRSGPHYRPRLPRTVRVRRVFAAVREPKYAADWRSGCVCASRQLDVRRVSHTVTLRKSAPTRTQYRTKQLKYRKRKRKIIPNSSFFSC